MIDYGAHRWKILALLLLITVINFIDRQTLSILAPRLKEVFHFNSEEYGRIVAAFQFGMLAAEFPMGMLMDRWGVRFGFTFAVLWWSLATAAHAFSFRPWHFGVARFWMGTGECGNYSGGLKTVTQWFPREERTLAIGIFNGGSMLGAMVAPPVIVWLNHLYGWQIAFLVPAFSGLLWVILWRQVYREPRPEEDHSRQMAEPPSSLSLLAFRQTWALMLFRGLAGPVVQFYWYWMPDYLHAERGMTLLAIGAFSWLPFLVGDAGSIAGGWVAGRFLRRGLGVPLTRRFTVITGAVLCLFSLCVPVAPSAALALAGISVVLFGHTFLSANFFASIPDLFPENAVGRVTGLTGIAGGLGGILFPLLTGFLVNRFSYTPAFVIAALLPITAAAVLFLLIPRWSAVDASALRPQGSLTDADRLNPDARVKR